MGFSYGLTHDLQVGDANQLIIVKSVIVLLKIQRSE
jgi:hypothetical protein